MPTIQILPYVLSVFSYLIPICCILPFKLKLRQKVILFVILLINILIFLFNIIIGENIGYSRKIITFNCILFACYFIISTVLIVNIIKAHMDKVDMNVRQDSYNRLQEYTNQIENMYSSLRSFKHDYSNIMLSMSGYIEANDMEGLKNYFGAVASLIKKS